MTTPTQQTHKSWEELWPCIVEQAEKRGAGTATKAFKEPFQEIFKAGQDYAQQSSAARVRELEGEVERLKVENKAKAAAYDLLRYLYNKKITQLEQVTSDKEAFGAAYMRCNKGQSDLKDEIDDWTNREAAICPEYVGFEEFIQSLQKQNSVLREALKFYADPRKYHGGNQKPDPDEERVSGNYRLDVTRDYGKKAKAALEAAAPSEKGGEV